MFDLNTYRDACSSLRLGQDKLEEMIAMTKNQKKKLFAAPGRTILLAATLTAALMISALAANPEVAEKVQAFFAGYTSYTFTTNDGTDVDLSVLTTPAMALTEREGRTIFTLDEQEYDVTEAFATDGKFTVVSDDGTTVVVTPDKLATLILPGSSSSFVFDLSEEGMSFSLDVSGEVILDGGTEVLTTEDGEGTYTITQAKMFSFTENEDGTPALTDGEGYVWELFSETDVDASGQDG